MLHGSFFPIWLRDTHIITFTSQHTHLLKHIFHWKQLGNLDGAFATNVWKLLYNMSIPCCAQSILQSWCFRTQRLNLLFVFFQSAFIDSSCQGQVRYFVLSGKKKDSSHTGNNSKPTENKISWKQITSKYQKFVFYYFSYSKIRPGNFTPMIDIRQGE